MAGFIDEKLHMNNNNNNNNYMYDVWNEEPAVAYNLHNTDLPSKLDDIIHDTGELYSEMNAGDPVFYGESFLYRS